MTDLFRPLLADWVQMNFLCILLELPPEGNILGHGALI